MGLVERVTTTLGPERGAHTADAAARRRCAKYGVTDDGGADVAKVDLLREFRRRGPVAYVGPERAQPLAMEALTRR
jgi:hypothetical protein